MFVPRAGERSCRCGLPRAEGQKGVAAHGEGRSQAATIESCNEVVSAAFRPMRCHAISSGGTPLGKPAAVRGRP